MGKKIDIGENIDEDLIDYDLVTELAKHGMKNPKLIAVKMGLPEEWFTDTYADKVNKAINRGLAELAELTAGMIIKQAAAGDFQAMKYLQQNIDDTWSDRREVEHKGIPSPESLPSLRDIFTAGLEAGAEAAKQINDNQRDEKVIDITPAIESKEKAGDE